VKKQKEGQKEYQQRLHLNDDESGIRTHAISDCGSNLE
jgi:hypothetical protein